MSASHNVYDIGSSGIPVNSTLSGKNVNESYLAHKTFSRLVLSSTVATQLPDCACGFADISSPLGNDLIYIGGISTGGDIPYLDPFDPTKGRGEAIYPGTGRQFRVANLNLLAAIAARNKDTININAHLSQQDFTTPTNDPPPNPVNLPPLIILSTNPVNATTAIPTNTVANVVLSRNIDPTTVTLGTNVTFSPAVGGLTAYVDPQNPGQINFDPHGANLAFTTLYTAVVSIAVKDISGTSISAPFSFHFTTAGAPPPPDVDSPIIQTVTPGNGVTGVAPSVSPVVYMGEAVQPAGVTTANVVLKDPNGAVVSTVVSLGSDNRTITINPSATLNYGSRYTISVTNLKDPENNTMVASASVFTTVANTQTVRYNVTEGGTHTGSLSSQYELGPSYNGMIAYGEKADSSKSGQNMVGFALTKVSIPNINTHGGSLAGSLTVEIRSSTAALRYAYVTSVPLSGYNGSNTPAGPIVISDPNNVYKMVNGDVLLVRWLSPGGSGNLEISTADNNNPPYGRAVFWNGGSGSNSYQNRTSDDLAATIYSSP